MNFGTFNGKTNFSKMQNESKSKGYNTSYCKVEKENHQSGSKTLLGILSICALGYMGYKYVIQPVAHTLRQIFDIDNLEVEERREHESRINKNRERVFDGKLHKLFDKEGAIDAEFVVVDEQK